ncbi:MAG: hypothetical protein WBQ26_09035 [Gemmatimonadaceae bacterium]|nr:hypothetical protein [Gemmatimonadaceae bacterium]
MFLPRSRRVSLLIAAVTIAVIGACSDNLESNAACPSLCPGQAITMRDTVIDAVVVDTTVTGFPAIGQERYMLISTRGDTIDTRAILRFDSLPTTWRRGTAVVDSSIQAVDSAFLVLRRDTSLTLPGAPITVNVYDVDTGNQDSTATDTAVAVLAPLFSPDRLLGSQTYAPDSLGPDSLKIPISNDSLLAYIRANKRLRLGVQVTGPSRAEIRVGTSLTSIAGIMFKPAAAGDTTGVTFSTVFPMTRTPAGSPLLTDLSDYLIVVHGTPPVSAPLLRVGGLPGQRVYIRFSLPSGIVDSTTVVRATLLLNQVPNPLSPDAHDTMAVWPQAVLATTAVTDLYRALGLLSTVGTLGLDTLERFAPADSGQRQFEMVQLVRLWHTALGTSDPRAVALVAQLEGASGAQYWFTPSSGAPSLRPRIRIVYSPNQITGITP